MSYYNIARIQVSQTSRLVFLLFCGSALSVILVAKKINAVLVDAVFVSGSPENEPLAKTEVNKKAS